MVGISQYYQMKILMKKTAEDLKNKKEKTAMDEMMSSMQFQMKYIMPIVSFFITFSLISVVGLYWFVSNLFAIAQEIYIRKTVKKPLQIQE